MPEPYYSDDLVTLFHGRCEDVLPTLDISGSVHLLTDPPYFKVKDEAWDNQWGKVHEFLDWMGEWLDIARPLLSADASVWVFASPELTSAVESVVAKRFRVLNSVRWLKEAGWHQKADVGAARSFLSPWEGIIFAEQFAQSKSGYETASEAVWRDVFAPIREYLDSERAASGVTVRQIAEAYQGVTGSRTVTGMAGHWFQSSQWTFPTKSNYEWLQGLLNPVNGTEHLRREYEDLRREYEDLRREYEDLRRPFTATDRRLLSDVWNFSTVQGYPGKHPCEKPQALLTHMIETTTRPGDTIIDPFAGSGAILDTARQLGRKAIGVEMDEHWCRKATMRLTQQTFNFAEMTA